MSRLCLPAILAAIALPVLWGCESNEKLRPEAQPDRIEASPPGVEKNPALPNPERPSHP